MHLWVARLCVAATLAVFAAVSIADATPSAETSFQAGIIALRQADWPNAIEHLRRAHALRPRHVDTLYYLAQAYYLDGQHAPALDTIQRAIAIAPRRAEIAQKYGEYLCEANQCT
jgi:type IV pilus assembly protein PilF